MSTFISNGIMYFLDDNKAEVVRCMDQNVSGEVVLPSSVSNDGNTYEVTSIGPCAFYCCFTLSSVVIPNSVTSIGQDAFCGCSLLSSVVIPNSVTNIEDGAFHRCYSLSPVVIPNSATIIGENAFSDCRWGVVVRL